MKFQNEYKKHIVWLCALISIGFSFFLFIDMAFWVSIIGIHMYTVLYIVPHLLLLLLCINKIITCIKSNIKIKKDFIIFCSVLRFYRTKICINDIKHISYEKNSTIHDAKYDEKSIIIDIFINETMYRIALNQNDFETFKSIPQISHKLWQEDRMNGGSIS